MAREYRFYATDDEAMNIVEDVFDTRLVRAFVDRTGFEPGRLKLYDRLIPEVRDGLTSTRRLRLIGDFTTRPLRFHVTGPRYTSVEATNDGFIDLPEGASILHEPASGETIGLSLPTNRATANGAMLHLRFGVLGCQTSFYEPETYVSRKGSDEFKCVFETLWKTIKMR